MKKYLNKLTNETVRAFTLTQGDINAIRLSGGECEAVEGDYMVVRNGSSRELLKRTFENNFIEIEND